jgi:hypothetical protein
MRYVCGDVGGRTDTLTQLFGGLGVILMGDPFQIRPTGGTPLTSAYFDDASPGGRLFRQFSVTSFVQQMRAAGDPAWTAVLDYFSHPEKSMTPVAASKLLDEVPVLSAADVAGDEKWQSPIIITHDNAARHAINKAQAIRMATRLGVPVIAWRLRLDSKSAAAFELAAKRHACTVDKVREPYEDELTFYFVKDAPAYLNANINVDKGLVNSASVRLHSLTLNPSSRDGDWARVAAAAPGEVVLLSEAPLSVNVEVSERMSLVVHWHS